MADEELKPRSFRIDEKTANKFKEISAELGGNQQEVMSKLIEAYEFQTGKAIFTERKADIEKFEKNITVLTRMYMGCLEDNQNVTNTVRAEFEAMLVSKDTVIKELQGKLVVSQQIKEESENKAKQYAGENAELKNEITELKRSYQTKVEDMQSMLTDKDSLNKALTDSCSSYRSQVEEMKEAAERAESMQQEFNELHDVYNAILKEKKGLEEELQKHMSDHERIVGDLRQHEAEALDRQKEQAKLAMDKALLELERRYQQEMQELTEKKQEEVDRYQKKYFELLEQIRK